MTRLKSSTKRAQSIIATFASAYYNKGSIYEAYKTPSAAKIQAFENIRNRALATDGYNHDLRVTGASCFVFSTMYSFRDDEGLHIVYDTPSDTVEVVVAE